MEEYTQITLDMWMQWKEDIRRKLQETAGNFVYIGYRLRQIRDSGMLRDQEDCENIFDFAKKEYGLDRSTVSRFMAINEKYSEGGYSIELQEKYRGFGQSQLAEMLTLPDLEIELITENMTVKEIRELKSFSKQEEAFMNEPEAPEDPEGEQEGRCQEAVEEAGEDSRKAAGADNMPEWTPLQKCIIDFFKDKKDLLKRVAENIDDEKAVSEMLAPSGVAVHSFSGVFILMYDYSKGVKYKKLGFGQYDMTWEGFIAEIDEVFIHGQPWDIDNAMKQVYGEKAEKKASTTACQPAKPVDVWEEKPVPESVRKEAESDQIGAESDQKEAESVQEGAESDQNVPESVRNEPETEGEPRAASQQEEQDPLMGEIQRRYDGMLKLCRGILEDLGNREFNLVREQARRLLDMAVLMASEEEADIEEALDALLED